MAKLSAHGTEIGRIDFLRYSKAYMSDGKVMKNQGFGWKLHAKVKPGITIEEGYQHAKKHLAEFLAVRPAYTAYMRELHGMAGLCKRWKLHAAVEIMPQDPDGVWSEVCDGYGDNISASGEDVCHLCELYLAAELEADTWRKEHPVNPASDQQQQVAQQAI